MASIRAEVESVKQMIIEGQRQSQNQMEACHAAIEKITAQIDSDAASEAAGASSFKAKVSAVSAQAADVAAKAEELQGMCSDAAIEAELKAVNALRKEQARIKAEHLDAEAKAESAYQRAKARVEADIALERSLSAARLQEAELSRARTELRIKREARERAELLYSTDLNRAITRLRERELSIDRARSLLSSTYERQRLYDSVRRMRLARTSLADELTSFDYRSRRLSTLYDYPTLYPSVATRYYDYAHPYRYSSLYPYYY